jgi:glutamate-ammonia-ligase adenylyltransferase
VSSLEPRDLLLARRLEHGAIEEVLGRYRFRDPLKADANLQAVADEPQARELLADVIDDLLLCLGESADPDQALNYFERFSRAAVQKTQLLSFLKATPRTMELLARTFGASPFMGDILVRDPVSLYWICDPEILGNPRTRETLEEDLGRALAALRTEQRQLDALRTFKRRELLHLGVRDILRMASVEQTLAALTLLAEVLIQRALRISGAALLSELGVDTGDPRAERIVAEFTVLGMGKLGGGELNFSSDVDLVYVYANDSGALPRPEGPPLSKDAFYTRLSRRLTAALADSTGEGQVYRVDLRLRPEGRMGGIAQPADAVLRYCATRGRTWERLAYLKARPVAGDLALGKRLLNRMRPFVYAPPLGPEAQRDIREIKVQIDRKVAARGQQREDVKLGFGGIREIELVAQTLQVGFGRGKPRLRERNTLRALRALREAGLLSAGEAETLRGAYLFLRDVENKLQMFSDAQTHSLPEGGSELRRLALTLGYPPVEPEQSFRADYRRHTEGVNAILRDVLFPVQPPGRLAAGISPGTSRSAR